MTSCSWKGLVGVMCLVGALVGCQSYEIVQSNVFVDDDANVVTVDYGRADSDHVNTFKAPTNGKEMEFRSRLLVKVTLPDGESFKAWQCMNFLRAGTMYMTDNERWKVLVSGFACSVFRQLEDRSDYREVFRGVLCDISDRKATRDERWKSLPRHQGTYRKENESVR